jgi:hypothetical protein
MKIWCTQSGHAGLKSVTTRVAGPGPARPEHVILDAKWSRPTGTILRGNPLRKIGKMPTKLIRCYGSRKRAMVQEHSIFASQESEERQFAKDNIRVERCVDTENLTWEDAFDPYVIVTSPDVTSK